MVALYLVSEKDNPADILSNNCRYTKIWGILQPLLFWMGDITDFMDLELKRDGGQEKGE